MWFAIIGLVLITTAESFGTFLLATVVYGLGCGLEGTTGTTTLSDIYPNRDSTAIRLSQTAGSIGTVVLPAVAGIAL